MAVKNLVSGVLAQSITTSTTNILVNIAENVNASAIQSFFPTPPFYITIMPKAPAVGVANRLDSEILKVTAVGSGQSGNASLTCVRGQRDTTAKAFEAGAIVTVGVYADDAVFLGGEGSAVGTPAPWVDTSDIKNGAITSDKIDFSTFASNGLPNADGSASRQNVGTVFYKKILPKLFLIWGNITPIYDDNSIALPFSSAFTDYSQVFTLYGAGMNFTKGFIAPGASSIGFTKQTTGNKYALWGFAVLNG